ncbi:hypothetical protein chiPu_0011360 [Chiloscyllium punctatum]|uniref:Uncharacterized protein n=1 Tax=Chiloscyllium punctatum TaxID=137246 RepID=A0A401SR97_CHIPU|nr:hypothetical protein [Chiloscyllium punctatum]
MEHFPHRKITKTSSEHGPRAAPAGDNMFTSTNRICCHLPAWNPPSRYEVLDVLPCENAELPTLENC